MEKKIGIDGSPLKQTMFVKIASSKLESGSQSSTQFRQDLLFVLSLVFSKKLAKKVRMGTNYLLNYSNQTNLA